MSEPPADAPSHHDDDRLRNLRRTARSYANSLRDTRKLVHLAQKHTDQMLAWSAWLMGAGLLALPAAFKDSCAGRSVDLLWVAVPWAAGLMFAYVGRMVAAQHRNADAFHYAAKWGGLQALLSGPPKTPDEFGNEILAQMKDQKPRLMETLAKTQRLGRWADAFYLMPGLCFIVGVSVVLWKMGRC